MYTPSCHSIAAYASVVIEAYVVAGFWRKLVVMLFKQVRVPVSEVTNSSSAEVNRAKAWRP
jgi:hypothetical protein